jgi:hypothetical protein
MGIQVAHERHGIRVLLVVMLGRAVRLMGAKRTRVGSCLLFLACCFFLGSSFLQCHKPSAVCGVFAASGIVQRAFVRVVGFLGCALLVEIARQILRALKRVSGLHTVPRVCPWGSDCPPARKGVVVELKIAETVDPLQFEGKFCPQTAGVFKLNQ